MFRDFRPSDRKISIPPSDSSASSSQSIGVAEAEKALKAAAQDGAGGGGEGMCVACDELNDGPGGQTEERSGLRLWRQAESPECRCGLTAVGRGADAEAEAERGGVGVRCARSPW